MVETYSKIRTVDALQNQTNKLISLFLICLLLFCSGCGTLGVYNPATGRREFIVIPTSTEISMGAGFHKQILEKYELSDDAEKIERLQAMGQRLAGVSDRQDYKYKFYLIEDDQINAFTIPGGNIYFFSGLFDKLGTDDEIAGVVAHEIGHCAARHTAKRFQAALGYSLIGALVLSQVDEENKGRNTAILATNAVMQLIVKAYSRQDEYQADGLAVKYLHLAGYDPNGMIKVLEFLQKESKGPRVPLILRTHPYVDDRLVEVKKEVIKIANEGGIDSE